MKIFNITDFGAIGDGVTDNAKAIQAAIDQCSENGGGMVWIPGGSVYLTGPFDLKSYVNFHVESGAQLLANPDEKIYKRSAFRENRKEGSIWIGGENAEKVSITGKGTIDGNGIAFMGREEKAAFELKPFDEVDPRPHIFTPVNFNNLTIKEVTFADAAYWCLHLVGCNDVSIEGIRILNNLKIRNSDGIDIDHSKNVRINNCYIESGDDCICVKTRREYEEFGPSENIAISNCIMRSTSCSIKLGSENISSIRNIVVSNCIIEASNRGIGIQNRDEGVIEDIVFSNIVVEGRLFDDVWWGKAEPIYVTSFRRENSDDKDASWRFAEGQEEGESGKVRNILFSDIICRSENGIFVGGDYGKVRDIRFDNVQIRIEKMTDHKGGLYDLRPSANGIIRLKTAGFCIMTSARIKIRDCSLQWGKQKTDDFGNGIYAENVSDLEINRFSGEAAYPEKDDHIKIRNCVNVTCDNKDVQN